MNIGLLGGLAGAFGSLSKGIDSYYEKKDEREAMERKLELTKRLQLEVLKAKQEYAEKNPEYKHFVQTPSGDIMGFSESGASQRYPGTPEDKQINADKVSGLNAYREHKVAVDQAMLDPKIGLLGAQTTKAQAEAERALHPQPKGKPAPPPNLKTPAQLMKIKADMTKQMFGADAITDGEIADIRSKPTQTPADAQILQQYQAQQASLAEKMAFYKQMTADDATKYATPGLLAPAAAAAGAPEDAEPDGFDDLIPHQ